MDLDMSIAAMSVGMHQAQVQQNLGVAVLKEAMDSSGQGLETMLSSMTESLDPNLGTMIDVLA
ncbi:MAG: YjfB family protein [Schwartzia sp.]|uniref:YjfB family protein n=1 Tax=Schwartzia succinivorans TaxID=55507 RepID=UPI00235656AC|nr:YjfB family protein [Schwartzia succinivorans]MBE6096847.1 putative motility protein [Schwartzia succinivorans]MBQ2047992.1 YjfB family protein [Schwartzia sp. (in: firmicutes)]MBQ4152232.1 YjfB family protein [Schwartzia sp. (in: firmicutes)]